MKVTQSNSSPVQNSSIQNTETSQARQTGRTQAATSAANKKTEKAANAAAAISSGSVQTDISSKGKELAHAKEVAQAAPDIREEKVAELRRRIAAGQYNVDPEAIADRMVNEHMSMAGIG